MLQKINNGYKTLIEFYEHEWARSDYVDSRLTVVFNSIQDSIQHLYAIGEVLKQNEIKILHIAARSGNKKTLISNEHLKILATIIQKTSIDTLILTDTNIKLRGLKQLIYDLRESSITCLQIKATLIEYPALIPLESLRDSKITNLSLSACNVSPIELISLSNILPRTLIEILCLSKNCFNEMSLKYFLNDLSETKIKKLDLSNNDLFNINHSSWTASLKNTPIMSLILDNNRINGPGLQTLMTDIQDSKIEELSLGCNAINNDSIELIAPCLSKTKLKVLNLKYNLFTGESLRFFTLHLPMTKIHTLSLKSTALDGESVHRFLNALEKTALIHLNLNSTVLNGLIYPLVGIKKLQILKLHYTGQNLEKLDHLAEALIGTNVVFLSLAQNHINDIAFKKMLALLQHTNVRILNLKNNSLTDESIEILRQTPHNLRVLNLNFNHFTSEGIIRLAHLLLSDPKIQKFYIQQGIKLTIEQGECIAETILSKTVPVSLEVVANGPGSRIIKNALRENKQFFLQVKNTLVSLLIQMKTSLQISLSEGVHQNPYVYTQQLDFLLPRKTPTWLKDRLTNIIQDRFIKYTEAFEGEAMNPSITISASPLNNHSLKKHGLFASASIKSAQNTEHFRHKPEKKSHCALF
ncbi:MAG: hypothetical protein H2069_02425 [Legionella sp.]|nr:hypothetical protein [Legionella sp.]